MTEFDKIYIEHYRPLETSFFTSELPLAQLLVKTQKPIYPKTYIWILNSFALLNLSHFYTLFIKDIS